MPISFDIFGDCNERCFISGGKETGGLQSVEIGNRGQGVERLSEDDLLEAFLCKGRSIRSEYFRLCHRMCSLLPSRSPSSLLEGRAQS